jgi:hypothetical protein
VAKITIQIRNGRRGQKGKIVEAVLFGDLAIHSTEGGPGLTLTHVPTGMAIMDRLNELDAHELKDALLSLPVDWGTVTNEAAEEKALEVIRIYKLKRISN